jgi:serine protease
MHKHLLTLLFFICLSLSLSSQTLDSNFVDGQLYVKTTDTSLDLAQYNFNIPELNKILTDFQVDSMWRCFSGIDTSLMKIYRMRCAGSWGAMDTLIMRLDSIPEIQYAERVPILYTSYIPNDFNLATQWYLTKIGAVTAWDKQKGNASIKVAIVDDGVRRSHEDLQANIYVNTLDPVDGLDNDFNGYTDDNRGFDIADDDNNPDPPSKASNSIFSHGTHCAGLVSAATDNAVGIAAIGFNVKIIPVKVAPDNSDGRGLTHAYEGIQYATEAGADVISMSFGGKQNSLTGQIIISRALAMGIVLVAAAGNEDSAGVSYPAAYNGVIAVGSTDINDKRSSFSNYGTGIDVMAPGSDIRSTFATTNSSYGNYSGTSMATPIVAGLAALVLSKDPGYTPAQVESFLEQGCDNIDLLNPAYAGQLGAGRINAGKTMNIVYGTIGTGKIGSPQKLHVYPNPSDAIFNLDVPGPRLRSFSITSSEGRLLLEEQILTEGAKIDLSGFGPGIYFFRGFDGEGKVYSSLLAVQ